MTPFFINAVSLKVGGSATVLVQLLDNMSSLRKDVLWHIAVDRTVAPKLPSRSNIQVHVFDLANRSIFALGAWYQRTLPNLLKETGANVLFSQTNYLPVGRLPCPTLLFVQHAGHFNQLFEDQFLARSSFASRQAWTLKKSWVRSSLKAATRITVQTQTLADAIAAEFPSLAETITVIPHSHGLTAARVGPKCFPTRQPIRIGYVSNEGVQKNFETLLRGVANVRRHYNHPNVRLILTLPKDPPSAQFRGLSSLIEALDLHDVIENAGTLKDTSELQDIYASLDLFVFPSLCESFGLPMVEAMASGLPLLVADTPENLEVTGGAALSFGRMDDEDLARQLDKVMANAALYESCAAASIKRAQDFSWRSAAEKTIETLEQMLESQRRRA